MMKWFIKTKGLLHSQFSQDQGSVIWITALSLAILIGLMGLAIDTSFAFYTRTKMQAAADAAALGAASNLANGGTSATALVTALSLANSNGFLNGSSNIVVNPVIPPGPNPDGSISSYSTNTKYVRVQISQSIPLFFAPVIGFNSTWPVTANAVAGVTSSPDCLVATNGFRINGTNIANLNNCSAVIGGNLDATNQSKIAVNGNGSINVYNNGSISCPSCTPTPIQKSGPLPTLPNVTIPAGLTTVADATCSTRTCQPGIYNSQLVLTKNTSYTFASGFYVFNQGLLTNSAIVNSAPNGVTFYIKANQPIDLSGTVTLTALSASGCSPGSGVLIYQEPSAITAMSLAGSTNQLNVNGIIDLPYSDITISGTSSNFILQGSIVAHSLSLNGNMNPSVSSNPCNNFVSQNKVSLIQ